MPSTTAHVVVTNGPDGLGHALQAVGKMAKLATAGAHTYEIRSLATRITHRVASKDELGELQALYRWVRDNIRYRHDPRGLEWIQAPARTLAERAGDCDDLATLLSALAQSLGFTTRYRTVGPSTRDQRHVSTEALCMGRWVSLDPVLEPPRTSTAPRAELGMFGERAPGASIYYSGETGQPMTLRGSTTNALWPADSTERGVYTAPLGPTAYRSAGSPGGGLYDPMRPLWVSDSLERGVSTAPLGPTAYGSAGAPGGGRYQSLVPIWRNPLDPSSLSGGSPPRVSEFNTGDVSRDASMAAWSVLTPAERARYGNHEARWRAIGKDARVSSRASWLALLNEVPTLTVRDAVAWWQGLSVNQRKARREKYTPGYGDDALDSIVNVAKGAVQVIPVYGQVVATGIDQAQKQGALRDPFKLAVHALGPAGGQLAPFVSKDGLRLTPGAVREAIAYNAAIMQSASNAAPASVRRVPSSAIPAGARPIGRLVSMAKEGAPSARAIAARLRRTGGNSIARAVRRVLTPQQFDAMRAQLARRGQSLSGLSLNWSLSGTTDSAAAAVAAVNTFISRNGRPPQIKVAAVEAMQREIPGLVIDGLWGNNSAKAAAWALSKPVAQMPAVAAPWAKKAATWQPPTAVVTPAPTPSAPSAPPPMAPKPTTPAPSAPPVVVATTPAPSSPSSSSSAKTTTRRTLAKRALDQVIAFRKAHNNVSPAVPMPAVLNYQLAVGLGADGLWGELTRMSVATDLGVKVSTLPPAGVKSKAKPTTTPAAPTPASKPAPSSPSSSTKPQAPPAPPPPKPPASTPSAQTSLKALAQKAVAAVRAFITKKGQPPQIAVKAVRDYQAARKLKSDGLWGDATRNQAAVDLGVKASTLPPVAAPFKSKPSASSSSTSPSSPQLPPPVPPVVPLPPIVTAPPPPYEPSPLPPSSPFPDFPVPPSATNAPLPSAGPPPSPDEHPSPPPASSSSGQGLLIALGVLMLSRRKRRAA